MEAGFNQICIWQGTVVGKNNIGDFELWMKEVFYTRAKYLEEVKTNPDIDKNGNPVPETGNRNDLFFAIHTEDIPHFSIKRLAYGIRWLEDVIKYNKGGYLYPEEILKKYPVRW